MQFACKITDCQRDVKKFCCFKDETSVINNYISIASIIAIGCYCFIIMKVLFSIISFNLTNVHKRH